MIIGRFACAARAERRELDRLEAIPRVIDRAAARGASRCRCRRGRGSACRTRACPPRRGRARTRARAARPSSASRPNARSPMIGFAGLVWTSSTGAKSMSKPSARSSSPIARPTCSATRSSSGAGRPSCAIIGGHMRRRRAHALDEAAFLIDRDQRRRAVGRGAMELVVERDERVEIDDLLRHRAARDLVVITRLRLNRIVAPKAPASRRARSSGGTCIPDRAGRHHRASRIHGAVDIHARGRARVGDQGPGQDSDGAELAERRIRLHRLIDVSARGEGRRTWPASRHELDRQVVRHLRADRPCIATADEIAEPNDVIVRFWNDGQLRHNYNTDDMEHRVPSSSSSPPP